MEIIHSHFFYLKRDVLETTFCFRLQVGPNRQRFKVLKMLTLIGGLCCVGFIQPTVVVAGVLSLRLDWVDLNFFHLNTETKSNLSNVLFKIKRITIGTVKKCDSYIFYKHLRPSYNIV
jgi:hypothetical protein